jgi:hypothetical protein
VLIGNPRWPSPQDKILVYDPILYLVLNLMPFNNKHGWNVPWEVLNKMCVFCVDWKFKMAVTAEHRTIIMGK